MSLAIALLSKRSFGFELYAAASGGTSARELAAAYKLSLETIEERLQATRLLLTYQAQVRVNRQSKIWES
jgi:hypothetical protein